MKTKRRIIYMPVRIRLFFATSTLAFLFGTPVLLPAQDKSAGMVEPAGTYLNFTVLSTSNDSVVLAARLFIRKGRIPVDLQNAPVAFGVISGENTMDLGSVLTDSTGTASLTVPVMNSLQSGEEGLITYKADFGGTDRYLNSSETFSINPASLKVFFYEEDSVRFIQVIGTRFAANGYPEALTEEIVYLFVPSLFRPLPIGEVYLDETGNGTLEFPTGLIGDIEGTILVIARIDEHDRYGYVKGEALCSWATPKHLLAQDKPTRELWTPVAPVWMIITLLVMLAGVWAHYIYAIIQLIRIRLSSKNEVQND